MGKYAELYVSQIVRLHGVTGEHLHQALGTKLIKSSAYHPQTSGQTERVNQILEDLLRACVISSKGSWEKWLPLAEISYNNSYQASIKMAPFEALYDRKCRTPLNWIEPGERRYFGIDFVNEADYNAIVCRLGGELDG